ncbi:serine/threonine-protein kinase PITSLRE isoform X2 [Calliphora vicina]|uniref:serine/threonine-protein kinase PITSLRE isoform X2 n=1 Tax=Calliphora vicina TaxID=7373 RepID=UPI00325B671C
MPNDDMSGSEDGQLRSPDGDDHIMLSGDDEHDTDSLDIKPPQAHVSRDSSGSRRKEKSKDKKHSKERRHKERYADSAGREKDKDYHRDSRQVERRGEVERKEMRRGNGDDRYQVQKSGYEREEYLAGSEKRYHAKHYERLSDDAAATGSRGSGNVYHHGGGGGNYQGHQEHQYHHHQQQQHHHHAQIQIQHRQRQDYYEHRRQQDYHHPPPTDYHNQRHHQQQHNQPYEASRGGGQKYHDHDMEKRKYASYDQSKDPESLEQDLRSRLLSKRHKYVKDDSMEDVSVARGNSYERLYEVPDHERPSKTERHKARRLKERESIIEVVDSPDAEGNIRHSQRKKHKRHKEKHEKRTALDDIIPPKNAPVAAATSPPPPEKRRSPENPELVARRAKLLAAEQEKEKRKEISRKELEARRELRRDRAMDTLSPTAVAASVTAGLNVQIKRKKSDEEDKIRKRIKKSKDSEEEYDEQDVEDDEDDSEFSDDSRDDDEDSVSNSGSDTDHSDYRKSKSKQKKRANHSDGEVSLPESPLSIGELSKSPKKSKKKAKKKKHTNKAKYSDDEDNEDEEEKHHKRSSRSGTISLSPSRSRSRTRSHTPARSRSRSLHSSLSNSFRSRSRSFSRSRSSGRSRSRSHSHSSSRSRSHSRTSRSRSLSKSRSRSRSRTEERDMKANSRKEENETKDKLPLSEVDKRKLEDSEDLPVTDDKGNPLPNYFPGIQGCRSVEEFQCLNRIEEGTYGVVYRAKDKRTNEIVALKRLKMEKEKEGFPITSLREINTLLKGQHPNIVTVREIVVGSNMDKIFIVMDYVEHDLKSLMETMKAKKQSFFPGEIKCLTQQLLRAVGHLHDNWILHRDLKTSNLLLSHKGILKVGDFGLAREYGSPLKKYTSLVVTLWYRAPELLLCSSEYSTPIDIWSVGCIFAEFLQMAPIFPGKSEVDELNRIFKELGTPNEKIWPGYNQLPAVKNMLSQNSQFADYPVSSLRKHFADKTSDTGIDLLQGLLTYDPKQRLSADTALKHQYFKELPVPIDPSMFPTWPAKSELGARKAMASSPKPPSGGSQFKQLGKDDIAGTSSGGKIISGIITGNKKTSSNTGFVLNAGIDQRQLAMGPGFNLKF